MPPQGRPRRNFVKVFDAGKTRMIGLPYSEKIWQCVKSFSCDTGTLRTDRRTDRQTDRFAISILRVSMLKRDKNGSGLYYNSRGLNETIEWLMIDIYVKVVNSFYIWSFFWLTVYIHNKISTRTLFLWNSYNKETNSALTEENKKNTFTLTLNLNAHKNNIYTQPSS